MIRRGVERREKIPTGQVNYYSDKEHRNSVLGKIMSSDLKVLSF